MRPPELKLYENIEGDIDVLFIDDDPAFLDLTARYFKRRGQEIDPEVCEDPEEALEVLSEEEIDCILCDHEMPKMNGIDLLKKVRKDYPELPFILFTSKGSEEVASEAISAGVTDYIQKEGGIEQYEVLENRIKNVVERKEHKKEKDQVINILETAKEGFGLLDSEREFIYVNKSYADIFGYEQSEIIGRSWEDLGLEENTNYFKQEVLSKVESEGNWNGTTTSVRKTGETFTAYHTLSKSEEDRLIWTVDDVTPQEEMKDNLRRSEVMTESMVEAVEDYAIFLLNPDGTIANWNKGAEKMKGYTENEIIGEHFSKFYTESDREQGIPERNLKNAREEGKLRDQGWRITKDGSEFWADVTITAIRDRSGKLQGFTKVTQDLTEQQQRESRMRARLQEFSNLASYDLENPLETLRGYIDLAEVTKNEEDFNKARDALNRMEGIIEDLRTMAKDPEDIEKQQVNLEKVFKKTYQLIDKNNSTYQVEESEIKASRTSLARMFGNLIENSIKHNEDPIHIEVGLLEDGNGFYYQDNGHGIELEIKDEILEHGFTTSNQSEGLGLYIVKRIADLHEWDIDIKESKEGGLRLEFIF